MTADPPSRDADLASPRPQRINEIDPAAALPGRCARDVWQRASPRMSPAVFDLVVVGAGAAGLAAARTALASGLTVVVLEAKSRIGGRAHTDTTLGIPWDRGAHWLHDASRNPFAALADAEGFAYDRMVLPRRLWSGGWASAEV
jgi:monoamine oxidase